MKYGELIDRQAMADVPDTNVGDTISRQAAIRWVKTECNPYGNPTLDFESGKKVIEHLEQMPSAQPGRKRGGWIVEDEFIDCSVCRREKWSRIPYGDLVRRFRYCPNCGADMRGEQ